MISGIFIIFTILTFSIFFNKLCEHESLLVNPKLIYDNVVILYCLFYKIIKLFLINRDILSIY